MIACDCQVFMGLNVLDQPLTSTCPHLDALHVQLSLILQGNRRRKLEARAIREAKKEEERRQLDLEEAKYQAQKRKEAIEKAKTQQYYQTDRVKNFHVS